jgi:hypothetical protein
MANRRRRQRVADVPPSEHARLERAASVGGSLFAAELRRDGHQLPDRVEARGGLLKTAALSEPVKPGQRPVEDRWQFAVQLLGELGVFPAAEGPGKRQQGRRGGACMESVRGRLAGWPSAPRTFGPPAVAQARSGSVGRWSREKC